MQKIQIIGNCGRDAEVKDFNGNQLISFPVAVSESYTDKQGEKVTNTIWFECSKWGNNTKIAQYIKKGGQIFVEGKVNNRIWEKEDGTSQLVNGITVFDIQLLGSKSESPQQPSNSFADSPKEKNTPATNFNEEEHDDLPF